jgi:hypothetical protein
MQPSRKIASNALLTADGVLHSRPLIRFDAAGAVVAVDFCEHPDREPFTEFRAGIVVLGFSREAFEAVRHNHDTPITELLPPWMEHDATRASLLTGLDYTTMRLTEQSRWEVL